MSRPPRDSVETQAKQSGQRIVADAAPSAVDTLVHVKWLDKVSDRDGRRLDELQRYLWKGCKDYCRLSGKL